MIDTSKPVQLVDGTEAKITRQMGERLYVRIAGRQPTRIYYTSGHHAYGRLQKLMNVPEAKSGSFVTRNGEFKAEEITQLATGQKVFRLTDIRGNTEDVLREADGRCDKREYRADPMDVIEKPKVKRVLYRNCYADGTVGSTTHDSAETARERSRYNVIANGVLRQEFEDGVLTFSRYRSMPANLRSRENPTGINPWEGRGY